MLFTFCGDMRDHEKLLTTIACKLILLQRIDIYSSSGNKGVEFNDINNVNNHFNAPVETKGWLSALFCSCQEIC
jgi:hypothetical protein